MSRFSRLETFMTMLDVGLVPVFYNPDLRAAKDIVSACADGGAKVIEFTNRGDLAWRVFCDLMDHVSAKLPQVALGAGSVMEPQTAALYINCGADFIVGPSLNPETARLCNRRKVAYVPGCATASEISQAEEWGAEIVKVFPGGQVGGPAFVKALMGPMPATRIMPTGGVEPTSESINAWIKAGAACLGMGSKLIKKDLVKNQDWTALASQTAMGLELVRKARQN